MVGVRNMRNESLNSNGKIKFILEFILLYNEPKIIYLDDFSFEIDENDYIMVDSILFGDSEYKIGRADNFSYIADSINSDKYIYSDNKLLIDNDAQPMRYYKKKIEEILRGLTPSHIRVWKVRRGRPELIDEVEVDYKTDDRYEDTIYVDAFEMQFLYRKGAQ